MYRDWFGLIADRLSSVAGPTIELGSGIGVLREVVPDIVTTDVEPTAWADEVVDAAHLPYADGSVANLVLFDVLHHLGSVSAFFDEAARALAPGGRVVIVDPYCSPVSTRAYTWFHEERTDLHATALADDPTVASSPAAANQARATLVFFRGLGEFTARWPQFAVVETLRFSALLYPLSGGFSKRQLVPYRALPSLRLVERLLGPLMPLLAFRCLVTLERR